MVLTKALLNPNSSESLLRIKCGAGEITAPSKLLAVSVELEVSVDPSL